MGIDIAHIMIPTRDGTRLSADLFRPVTDDRVPAVVEYTPYRKDDLRGASRDFAHFYFAARGIASVQLDVRGTGGSEGVVLDEYQYPQEQEDGYDAIEWLALQPWCNGRVGLWGTSYAGFTALQIAQLHPPSLGAIAPIYATDDRYTDDMHFRGGALNGWSVIGPYALGMVSRNGLPPYPELTGEQWKGVWDLRLRGNTPWLIRWLEEQLDGDYWRSTLGRRYDSVRVPTLIIGGWADFYVNATLRWFAHLKVPRKLIMGPWPHTPPDTAHPGPRIDFLHEVARWFTEFLKGQPTGIRDEPPVTVFIRTSGRPDAPGGTAPGYWRFEETIPPTRAMEHAWYFAAEGELRSGSPADDAAAEREYLPFVGCSDLGVESGGGWDARGGDEAASLMYTSRPLANDVEILGSPRVRLFASVATEVAFFAVRLYDVAPHGPAALVCKGLLNGTRRAGMDRLLPLASATVTELTVELDATSWVFPRGHRIRVAVSGADFPEVWPSPLPTTIRIHSGPSRPSGITLPVIPAGASSARQPAPLPPPSRRSRFQHTAATPITSAAYDAVTQTMMARRELKETVWHPDGMTVVTSEHRTEMSVSAPDPSRARAAAWDRKTFRRPGLDVECTATAELRSTASEFHLDLDLHVTMNGSPHWHNRWTRAIPRRLL